MPQDTALTMEYGTSQTMQVAITLLISTRRAVNWILTFAVLLTQQASSTTLATACRLLRSSSQLLYS